MHYTWTSKFKVGERRKLQSFLWFIYKTKHSSSLKIVFLCWWWRLMVVVLVLWCHQLNEIHYTLSYFLLNPSCKRRNNSNRNLLSFSSSLGFHLFFNYCIGGGYADYAMGFEGRSDKHIDENWPVQLLCIWKIWLHWFKLKTTSHISELKMHIYVCGWINVL